MDPSYRTFSSFIKFFTTLLVITALYLGREVLIPLALACLFTFLLNPVVKRLCLWGLPRVASVCIVTIVSFSSLALIAGFLGKEMTNLANDLPNHQQNIQRRVQALKSVGDSGVIQKLRKLVSNVSDSSQKDDAKKLAAESGDAAKAPAQADQTPPANLPQAPADQAQPANQTLPANQPPAPADQAKPADQPPAGQAKPADQPPPPEAETLLMRGLNMVVPTLAQALGTAAVVILFVIFMLLRLDDISQRIARLVGYSRLTLTTKAFGEAADRISRYLLMQSTVNGIYAVLLATGLFLIGLPYVVLWGALAGMFRFIPYVGPWIVAVLPIGLSLTVFDGWTLPLMVIALVIVLELGTNMILEPVLYGHSVGVSDFALLVAIAFWTWLWDGVGLVLATPLTVCIVVFCKHIPNLEWVDLMMGENPPPQPHLSYYQHHLAGNESAAQVLLEAAVKQDNLESALESIALPALAITRREESLEKLTPAEARDIYQSMRESITLLDEKEQAKEAKEARKREKEREKNKGDDEQGEEAPQEDLETQPPVRIFGRALHGEGDSQALQMLAAILPPNVEMEVSDAPRLVGELVSELQEKKPSIICVSALPQRSQLAASTLCRRLRGKFPQVKILVCQWTLPEREVDARPLKESGATWVASTLTEARQILEEAIPSPR